MDLNTHLSYTWVNTGTYSYKVINNIFIVYCSLSIPPGTKVCLTGTIAVKETYLMLDSNNTKVLGGEVEKLKEKWELNKVNNTVKLVLISDY